VNDVEVEIAELARCFEALQRFLDGFNIEEERGLVG